jgi:chemotaxis protein MotB
MAKPGNGAVIIKKIKKGSHGGHHGGAWKVAYADFVTAMMAFFLLLWLLNVTTDEQKKGIADYFDPSIATKSMTSGAGGLLGGIALGKPGSKTVDATAPAISVPIPTMRQPEEGEDGEEAGSPGASPKEGESGFEKDRPLNKEQLDKQLAEREEKQFAKAEFDLRQAIQDVPDLRPLAENLIVDRTPEGLRIQLVDQEKSAMFPLGSSDMADNAKKLMGLVAEVVKKLPNKVSLAGHTDATPYSKGGNYGNWELSADRANASRRVLLQGGLGPERVAKVVGMADRDLMFPNEPTSPRNRRISIVLLRDAPPPSAAKPDKRDLAQR